MKDFRGMKRQRNRNRKPSGNQNNPNRAYESNGPEGTKVRGNAQTIYEKYQQLARDANSSGDRVLAENHLQHAEHYFRMIRQMQPQRPVSEFVQRDPFSSGFDDFDEDLDMDANDGEAEGASDDQPAADDQPRFEARDRAYNDRQNQNGERQNNERSNGRDNRQGGDRGYNDRQNNDRNNGNTRDRDRGPRNFDRPNGSEQRNFDRPNVRPNGGETRSFEPGNDGELNAEGRRETRRERYERRRQQRFAEQEQNLNSQNFATPNPGLNGQVTGGYSQPQVTPYIASIEPLVPVSRAPQPAAPVESAPTSYDIPAAESAPPRERPARREKAAAAVDASHLPAFLSRPTPVAQAPVSDMETPEAAAGDAPPKPRRGRKRKEDISAAEEA